MMLEHLFKNDEDQYRWYWMRADGTIIRPYLMSFEELEKIVTRWAEEGRELPRLMLDKYLEKLRHKELKNRWK